MSEEKKENVVTRIAPSPTGAFHIGTARTALFNYLFAKKHNGTFIVRFEDTDRKRSEKIYEQDILDALKWLNVTPDKIARQSDRAALYEKYIQLLLKSKKAYLKKEPAKDDPSREIELVRFKNSNPNITFTDTVRGKITMDISDLGDFVIAKSLSEPLYNLAVVIDDLEMGVTHILRGDDHIANTPRQIALIEALGAQAPIYTHIPLIHSPSGGKLSKRKDAVSVTDFKKRGYLPDALINMIALLGWSPKDEQEIFSLEELSKEFSLERIQTKEAIFNEKKLEWFNKHYVKEMPESELRGAIVPTTLKRFPLRSRFRPGAVKALLAYLREKGALFEEERNNIQNGDYDFYFAQPVYEKDLLLPKSDLKKEELEKKVSEGLARVANLLRSLNAAGEWNAHNIKEQLWGYAETEGKALILWPLRVALTGKEKSPDPFSVAEALGKQQTIKRIQKAIEQCKTM